MSFTKKDIIKNIQIKEELSQRDSSFFLDEFLNFIKLNKNSKINLNRFGTFYVKETPTRVGRNPKTKKSYRIMKRKKLFFGPSKVVKDILN